MSKTFILTEKPSQALDFTKGLGEKFNKENDAYESEHYIICHARGHLIELCEPQDYDSKYQKWNKEDLPIIPETFRYKVKSDVKHLFSNIKKQLRRPDVDKIVIATDAEREGELIARLILQESGVTNDNKSMYRFWTSSALTPDEIQKGMAKLKPLSEYDRYYKAASARQQADWLVGLNATRAASIKANGALRLGRVQTPTLKILYLRNKEINEFKSEKYYEVNALFNTQDTDFKGSMVDDKGVIIKYKENDYNMLTSIVQSLQNKKGIVKSIEKKQEKSTPPKLFSLSTLQKEASNKHGIKASEVLSILQSLYDDKLTTYPRTDSEVLSEDMVDLVSQTIKKLSDNGYSAWANECKVDGSNKNVFNNAKLTDHHAVIPTGKQPSKLDDNQRIIYKMIVERFLAQFMPLYEYETTKVIIGVDSYTFLSKGQKVIKLGWKAIQNNKDDEILPTLNEGDSVDIKEMKAEEKKTTPPPHYTDGSLIEAMSKADTFIDLEKEENKELKEALKNAKGIGTPATKASIIEKLVNCKYVNRKGKSIIISEAGIKLIEEMGDEQITDPVYTGIWELELEKIAKGEVLDTFNFSDNIKKYTKHLVGSIFNKNLQGIAAPSKKVSTDNEIIGKCPVCGHDVITYDKAKGYFCSNKEGGCKFVLWKNKLSYCGKDEISKAEAKEILQAAKNNEVASIKLKNRAGEAYVAKFKLVQHEKYGWGLEKQANDYKRN